MRRFPRVLQGATFDLTRTRFCLPYESGIACYRGILEPGGEWNGKLVGVTSSERDARRFLDGALVSLRAP